MDEMEINEAEKNDGATTEAPIPEVEVNADDEVSVTEEKAVSEAEAIIDREIERERLIEEEEQIAADDNTDREGRFFLFGQMEQNTCFEENDRYTCTKT